MVCSRIQWIELYVYVLIQIHHTRAYVGQQMTYTKLCILIYLQSDDLETICTGTFFKMFRTDIYGASIYRYLII